MTLIFIPLLRSVVRINEKDFYVMQMLPEFFGKKGDLKVLKNRLINERNLSKVSMVSICGESGIGKTELAIAFANIYKKYFSLVFWIDGSTQETINQSYLNLGEVLGIKESDLNRLQWKIHRKLEKKKQWLLIFDDLKNFPKDLPRYGGSIIFTCRDKGICTPEILFEIKKSMKDAVLLLVNLTGEKYSETMNKLVIELDSLPLLINFAGNYINKTPGLNISKYYEIILKNQQDKKKSLIENHYPKQLKATYNITFKLIREKEPLAIDFLNHAAFLHAKNIPLNFLSLWLARGKCSPSLIELKQGDILRELENHSLIRIDKNQSSFSIHYLLQQILIKEDVAKRVEENIETILSDPSVSCFNPMNRETIQPFQRIVPHCISLFNHVGEGSKNALRLAWIVARYFLQVEREVSQAENYLSLAESWTGKRNHPINGRVLFLLGIMNHIKASDSTNSSAENHYLQKSLECFEKAHKTFMGYSDHKDYVGIEESPFNCNREYQCATCLQYQGQILRQLEQYENAERKLSEALLAFRKITDNGDHYDIARTLREQGMLLATKGKYVNAIEKIHAAIDMQKRIYRKEFRAQHTVGVSYKVLGNILFQKGDYHQANQAYIEAIEINNVVYKDISYPHSLAIYQKRADIYRVLELPGPLSEMERKIQEIISKRKGDDAY